MVVLFDCWCVVVRCLFWCELLGCCVRVECGCDGVVWCVVVVCYCCVCGFVV